MGIMHQIKTKDGGLEVVSLTARKAIIKFCYECIGYQKRLVKGCTAKTCPLWPFRISGTAKSTVFKTEKEKGCDK